MVMHRIYAWFRGHLFAVDVTLAAALWLLVNAMMLLNSDAPASFIIASGLIVPLAWRRSRPVAATAVIAAVAIVQWALSLPQAPADIAVVLVLYAVAAYGPRWASIGGLILALVGAVMFITRYNFDLAPGTIAGLSSTAFLLVVVWMLVLFSWTLGDLTRTRRLREEALEGRARRLEVEQQQELALAASDERSHIAREMHDIVAHSLSVIITQADGGRYAAAADPAVAAQTLTTIAEAGRTSLQEMRRLLGVLRGDEEVSTRPVPGLTDIDELLLGFRAAGLVLDFEQSGKARRALPAGAELTAYRIVQEGLTNVLKHAGPRAAATATLQWQGRGLQVDVLDDGRGAASGLSGSGAGNGTGTGSGSGTGHGIRGMRERVRLYDGTLTAKPEPGGGFRISAFIPYTEA
ncbi:sensor histidine kinase [Arthrobacter sp. H14-L1]|uniref:sensor histidine kinase n=1 Tax=Arthrobacter sp. H14-L1 TaxID=2996697 RepID=UPI003B63352D